MTHDDALECLADHPHLWRFVELTADDNADVEQRDAYRDLVIRLATGEPPGRTPPPVAVDYGTGPARPCGGCPGW